MAWSGRKQKLLAQAEFDFSRFLVEPPVEGSTATAVGVPEKLSATSRQITADSQHLKSNLTDSDASVEKTAAERDGGIKAGPAGAISLASAPLAAAGQVSAATVSAACVVAIGTERGTDALDGQPLDGRPQNEPSAGGAPAVDAGTSAAAAYRELPRTMVVGSGQLARCDSPISAVELSAPEGAKQGNIAAAGDSPPTRKPGCAVVLDAEDDDMSKLVNSCDSDSDSDSGEVTSSSTSVDSSSSDDDSVDDGPKQQSVKSVNGSHTPMRNDGAASPAVASNPDVSVDAAPTGKLDVTRAAMTKWRQGRAMSISDGSDDERHVKTAAAIAITDSDCCNSDSDSLDEIPSAERKSDKPPTTKGELSLEDMPPLEELQISVPETVAVREVGSVKGIVDSLVIVASLQAMSPLDIDTILFLDGRKPLGKVFEVFGPVPAPFYSVRFNSPEEISSRAIAIGQKVYYAPSESALTRYVFVENLKAAKGSDASWKDNNEPPAEVLEYSDDEKEREARKGRRRRGREASECDGAENVQPQAWADAAAAAGTPLSDTITDWGQGHRRGRRGRNRRGGRGRPFASPSPSRGAPGVSFITPGPAGAAPWGTPAGACWQGTPTVAGHDGHYWMSPPPFVSGGTASASSCSAVPGCLPAVPAQALQHGQSQSTTWQSQPQQTSAAVSIGANSTAPTPEPVVWQQYQQAQQPPSHAGSAAVAWPQVKQEPYWDWTETVAAPNSWAQPPASDRIATTQPTVGNDVTGIVRSACPSKGRKAGRGRGSAGAGTPVVSASQIPAKLPVIIDTRYVQSSQPAAAAGSDATLLKPCASWPDYDD